MADYSVSAELKAKIDRFKRPVRQAKKLIENYKKQAETIRDAKLTADASDVMKKSDRAKQAIKNFQKMKASGLLDLTTKALQRKLASAKKKLSDFGKISEKAKVDADVQGAITKTNRFKAMLRSIPNRKRVELNVSGNFMKMLNRARTQMDTFQKRMDRLATAVRTFGVLFGNAMKGFVVSNLTTIVPLIANAVPAFMALGNAVGTVGGGALGLASSLGAAGAGFAGLMPFLTSSISSLYKMEQNIAVGSKQWDKLSGYTKKAINALSSFQKTYGEIQTRLQKPIFKAAEQGIKGAETVIKRLEPALTAMANQLVVLGKSFRKNLDAADVKPLFGYLESAAPRAFTNLAKAAGNFGVGLANVLKAFDPLAKYMEQGLLNMSKSFRNFAAQLENSENLKRFIEYVKTNLPLIGNIFGRTFKAIINMFASFSSNSNTIFEALDKMTQKFLKWSQTFAQSNGFQTFMQYIQETGPKVIALIGNLVQFFVSLGVALAPVGKVMLTVTNAVLSFMTSLLQSNKVVGIAIGVLTVISGIFMTLAPVVIALGTAFGPLIMRFAKVASKVGVLKAALLVGSRAFGVLRVALLAFTGPVGIVIALVTTLAVLIIKNWTQIKAVTLQVWASIKNTLSTVMESIGIDVRAVFESIVQFFVSVWQRIKQAFISGTQPLVTSLQQTWTSIQNSVRTAMTTVWTFIQQIWTQIKTFWNQNGQQIMQATQNLWNMITQIFQAAWALIGPIVKQGWNLLKQIFSSSMQVMAQVVRTGWALVQTVFQTAWTLISGIVRGGIDIVLGIVKVFASLFTGDLKGMWEGVKMIFRGALTVVQAIFKAGWQLLSGIVKAVWPLVVTAIQSGWESIKQLFRSAGAVIKQVWLAFWNALKSVFGPIFEGIKNAVVNGWNAMKERTSTTLNVIKAVVVMVWNAVKNAVTTAVNAIKDRTVTTWNAIKTAVTMAVNAIKQRAVTTWNAIKTAVVVVVNAIKQRTITVWNMIKTAVVAAVNAIKQRTITTWNMIKTGVATAVNAIKSVVTTVWNAIKSAVQNAVQAVSSRVSSGFNKVRSVVQSVMNAVKSRIQSVWNGIKSFIVNAISAIASRVTNGFNRVRNIVQTVMNAVRNIIRMVWRIIQNIVQGAMRVLQGDVKGGMNQIRTAIRAGMNLAKTLFRAAWNAVKSIVKSGVDRVKTTIQNGMNRAVNIIRNIGSKFKNAGRKIVSMLADGIKGAVGKVTGAIKGVVKKARDFLPFSPAKTGPLRDIHKLDFGGPMGGAIRKGAGKVVGPMRTMMGQARAAIDGSIPGIKKSGAWTSRGLADGIKSQKNRVQSASAAISKGVKSKMDAVLRIASPSKETFKSGKFAGQGFYNGLKSMLKPIQNMAGSIAETVKRSMKAATQAKKAQQSSPGGTGMWNNKAVRKYMQFVAEEGDWMNDWISQVPEAMKKAVMRKGFKLAGAVDGGHSDTSKKHAKRLLGAVPNTANLTRSLNKAANQKLGNSVAKKDQVNVYVEGNSEWLRAYVNSRNADEDVMKKF